MIVKLIVEIYLFQQQRETIEDTESFSISMTRNLPFFPMCPSLANYFQFKQIQDIKHPEDFPCFVLLKT